MIEFDSPGSKNRRSDFNPRMTVSISLSPPSSDMGDKLPDVSGVVVVVVITEASVMVLLSMKAELIVRKISVARKE